MGILLFATKTLGLLFCINSLPLAWAEKRTKLINNGYEGVVIAIHPDVPEDERLINAIKKMMIEASDVMYKATRSRAYFKQVTILVPKTWTRETYKSAGNITFEEADIRIAPPDPGRDHTPYARGYRTCEKQGLYIHLTPAYVVNDIVSIPYGSRGRVVVHEWAHYRWGVKDEYPTGGTEEEKHKNSFYLSTSGNAEYTRCNLNIRGRLRDGDGLCQYNERTRLPLFGCKFQRYRTQPIGLRSSLMYGQYIPVEKIASVKRVSEIFLRRLIGDGTFVGLVDFNWDARTLSQLIEVKQEDASRVTLINALQGLNANGGTAIGLGIQKGIQVLEEQNADGGHLFVLTDGEETTGPTVTSITDEVVSKGVIVHSIFFGLTQIESGASLVILSEATGGKWYYSDDAIASLPELTSIFAALALPDDGDFSSASVQISSSVKEKQANEEISSSVAIDGSVGNQTSFIFSWSSSIQPTIDLAPPHASCIYSNAYRSNITYCGTVHETDVQANTVAFNIPGTAEVGLWEYNIKSVSADVFTVTVTSAASAEGIYPIIVVPELTISNVSGSEAAIVVTTVFQNTIPVLGAAVTAIITRPNGEPVILDLLDNGAGADVTRNDGVYSRYFSQFNAQGRYSVQVNVFKNGTEPAGVANVPRAYPNLGEVLDDGTFVPTPGVNIPEEISGAKIKGVLQRIATTSGLSHTGTVSNDSDIFPPNKITDLTVKQVDVDNADAGLQLEFTAPGDDYDFGLATRYDIRYTNGSSATLLTNFTNQLTIESGSDIKPKPSLQKEEIVITIPAAFRTAKAVRIAIAIRSFDEVNNPSEISNVAAATFFTEPPPAPPASASSSFRVNLWIFLAALGVALNI